MGRPKASPTTQVSQQPQEYHSHSVSQSPDTIDDAVPPPSETCNNENQPGIEPSEIPNENEKNNQHSYQPQQQAHSIPQAAIFNNQIQATTPLPFPPQTSQTNVYHFPPENHQMRSPTGAASLQPPQPNPQVFPPSQDEPQAFPPQADPKPQAFPPPQGEPQAFPPPQGNPQAFPPHEADQNPQAFPPPQGEPQAFPHPQGKPQAFPPPQAFPQQATIFQQQQQNGMQFPQNIGNFYHPSSTVSGQMGVQNAMPHSPFHPTPQNMMNNATPGFPVINQNPIIQVPTEDWKTGLFECMNDPTNALVTACFPCVTFGQIAEIIDSGQTSCGTSGLLYGVIACVIAMPCLISCTYRTKLRGRFGLIETPAPDWVIHCFCEYCALCQEYRELKERGLDPSIGWLGNLNKQKQMVQLAAMSPPMRQTMMGH